MFHWICSIIIVMISLCFQCLLVLCVGRCDSSSRHWPSRKQTSTMQKVRRIALVCWHLLGTKLGRASRKRTEETGPAPRSNARLVARHACRRRQLGHRRAETVAAAQLPLSTVSGYIHTPTVTPCFATCVRDGKGVQTPRLLLQTATPSRTQTGWASQLTLHQRSCSSACARCRMLSRGLRWFGFHAGPSSK